MQVSARARTIARLRELLLRYVDPKVSLCKVMALNGLYCKGFAAWDNDELQRRFHWFCLSRPSLDREELETLADRWQLADQTSRSLAVPCDIGSAAPSGRRACMGWARFSDEQLLAFVKQLEALEEP